MVGKGGKAGTNVCTSFNMYLGMLSITYASISSLDFNTQYLKQLSIHHCSNLKNFSYDLKNIRSLSLSSDSIEDLTGATLGDSLVYNIELDSNNLPIIPISFLQKIQSKSLKIGVDKNSLGCAPGAVLSLLNQIAVDPNWLSTQKICTRTINNVPTAVKSIIHTNYSVMFDVRGRKIFNRNASGVYIIPTGFTNRIIVN
jgi:hypothetical protein